MVYYVYLIKTLDGYQNKSYVGYTNDLKKRLVKRGDNTKKQIKTRLSRFSKELDLKNKFDKIIYNEDLNSAKEELIKTVNNLTK